MCDYFPFLNTVSSKAHSFLCSIFLFSLLLLVLGDSPSFLLVCFRCTKTARGHPDVRALGSGGREERGICLWECQWPGLLLITHSRLPVYSPVCSLLAVLCVFCSSALDFLCLFSSGQWGVHSGFAVCGCHSLHLQIQYRNSISVLHCGLGCCCQGNTLHP